MQQKTKPSLAELVASSTLNHYLDQCYCTVNWNLYTKFRWNLISTFYLMDMHLNTFLRWRSFCLALNVLTRDDVIKWEYFPRHWTFMRGIHRWPVKSPHKGQWRRAVMFYLICAWTNGWVRNRVVDDLSRHGANYDVIVMCWQPLCAWVTVKDLAIHTHHQ